MDSKTRKFIGRGVTLERVIGEGTFGVVYEGVWPERFGSRRLAVKVPKVIADGSHSREVAAMEVLSGAPGVLPILATLPLGKAGEREAVVTPLYERTLRGYTDDPPAGGIPVETLVSFARQLLRTLAYADHHGVIHRDVSESNILMDGRKDELILADWGTATTTDRAEHDVVPASNCVTALWYRAPELVLGCAKYGAGVDVWSAGIVLGALAGGEHALPITRASVRTLQKVVDAYLGMTAQGEETWGWARGPTHSRSYLLEHSAVWFGSSPGVRIESARRARRERALCSRAEGARLLNVIEGALTPDPARRPSASDLLHILAGRPRTVPRPLAEPFVVSGRGDEEWDKIVRAVCMGCLGLWRGLDWTAGRRARRRRTAIQVLDFLSRTGAGAGAVKSAIVTSVAIDDAAGAGGISASRQTAAAADGLAPGPFMARDRYLARLSRALRAGQATKARAESYLLVSISSAAVLRLNPTAVVDLCIRAASEYSDDECLARTQGLVRGRMDMACQHRVGPAQVATARTVLGAFEKQRAARLFGPIYDF